jgi:Holliday junction DNA helicase RuvB
VGQKNIVSNLQVFIESCKQRKDTLEHILFTGPPGLGKTTLSYIIANELNSNIISTNANAIEKIGDVIAMLSSLEEGDIFFIDEIHRLKPSLEEILYSAMEDYYVDVIIGSGLSAKSIKLPIKQFTLIGATTKMGLLSSPLISRFGIHFSFSFYSDDELMKIAKRTVSMLDMEVTTEAIRDVVIRSRKTPRILNNLLKRMRDFMVIAGKSILTIDIVREGFLALGIDEAGLNAKDREILRVIIEHYGGGPVGIKNIAIAVGEDIKTIEERLEPYLITAGFIKRSVRGRIATLKAYDHIKKFKSQEGG